MKYKCEINKERQFSDSFIVCLLKVPDFPNCSPTDDFVKNPFCSVISANDKNGEWSFTAMDYHRKKCIEKALLEYDAKFDEWLYCDLFRVFEKKGDL